LIPDEERTAFESIIRDFENHYNNFDKFLDTEVRFHAKILKVDFEKAKAAVISWVEQNHAMEYFSLT